MSVSVDRRPSHRSRFGWFWWGAALVAAAGGALTAYVVLSWPDVAALQTQNPRTTAFIDRYRASQRSSAAADTVRLQWVSGSAISPHLKRAVVVAEDIEFFSHDGFSTSEIRAAIEEALQDRRPPRGASTISQQLAKNLWLSPTRSLLRKLKEVALTRQLEKHLSKERILELYLNVVEFGPGIYGAQAAAAHYFRKSAVGLTEQEAALLAASLPRPSRWNPSSDSPAYRRYVADIEARMDRATFLWRRIGEVPPPRLELDTLHTFRLEQGARAGVVGDSSGTSWVDSQP